MAMNMGGPQSGPAGMTGRQTATTLSEINVTPLVDVMLVLLIVFMVSAPLMQQGVQVDVKPANYVIPRDSIESICVLPDAFDISEIEVTTDGQQFKMVVKNGTDCYLGELGEG